jgi:hypothetical protein
LLPDGLRAEAHLLDHALESGVASIVGFFLDAGDSTRKNVRDREVLGRNGWAVKD